MGQKNPPEEQAGGPTLAEKNEALLYGIGALALTVAVRLYLFNNYYAINNDGVAYVEAARHFWEMRWREGLDSFFAPLFPLMIAGIFPLVGDWELAGQFWPMILGLLLPMPLFAALRNAYGTRVALAALWFYALNPYLARLSVHVRSEIPYIFLLLIVILLVQRVAESRKLSPLFPAGLVSGLAYLARPEGAGLIAVASLSLFFLRIGEKRPRRLLSGVALLSLGFALVAAPYPIYLRWDTGQWMISRKTGFVLSEGVAEYDASVESRSYKELEGKGITEIIARKPGLYVKKVMLDLPRSLSVYIEAVHYSYLLFLLIGLIFFFQRRFWEKKDFLLFLCVAFYLLVFAMLAVNRRFAVPLAALSVGWVASGYLTLKDYFLKKWGEQGRLLVGIVILAFLVGTLPKTLQPIGREKLYLREAGLYLRSKPGNPAILTTESRVAFYGAGANRISIAEKKGLPEVLASPSPDYLALDRESFEDFRDLLERTGWVPDREFVGGPRESLWIFRRARVS